MTNAKTKAIWNKTVGSKAEADRANALRDQLDRLAALSAALKVRLAEVGQARATEIVTAAGIKPLDLRYADTDARIAWLERTLGVLA